MAEGALIRTEADIVVSVTGVAGPGGGTKEKPVGLVHLAVASKKRATLHIRHNFTGDRQKIQLHSVSAAINLLLEVVKRK